MKVTIIFGSSRKNGNTASLLAPFMDELEKTMRESNILTYMKNRLPDARSALPVSMTKPE